MRGRYRILTFPMLERDQGMMEEIGREKDYGICLQNFEVTTVCLSRQLSFLQFVCWL